MMIFSSSGLGSTETWSCHASFLIVLPYGTGGHPGFLRDLWESGPVLYFKAIDIQILPPSPALSYHVAYREKLT